MNISIAYVILLANVFLGFKGYNGLKPTQDLCEASLKYLQNKKVLWGRDYDRAEIQKPLLLDIIYKSIIKDK